MRTLAAALLLCLPLAACDAWFGRRIDLPGGSDAAVARAVLAYARERDIPCGETASLPLECWRQPIRIWAVATEHGVVVCYSAMGLPLEQGKFSRRMDELEASLRDGLGVAVAASAERCPPPPQWRS